VSRSNDFKTGIKMINYKLIADSAQDYPDYQSAFDAMSVEMGESTYRDMTPNALKMWAATFPVDYQALYSADDAFSRLAMSMINSESAMLYVSDLNVHPFINALLISEDARSGLFLMAIQTNLTWPNLKIGHVQNAMQKREAGEI
jgi:hypothetical protein